MNLLVRQHLPQRSSRLDVIAQLLMIPSIAAPIYGAVLGSYGPVVFFAFALLATLCVFAAAVDDYVHFWPVLAFPFFAIASTTWSAYPDMTFRFSMQLFLTVIVGITVGTVFPPRNLIRVMFAVLFSAVLFGFLAGNVRSDGLVTGISGSKNAFAFNCSLTLLTAFALFLDPSNPRVWRLGAVGALLTVPPLLFAAGSAGALIALMPGLLILLLFSGLSPLSARSRSAARTGLVLLLVILAVIFVIAYQDIIDLILAGFGKDSSFTGRTFLWLRAHQLIGEHPIFGRGFQSFWVQGNLEAEGLWRYFQISSRMGFHFHNMYLQTTVDVGIVGLMVALTVLAITTTKVLIWAARYPSPVTGFFAALLAVLLIRTPVEVDFNYQFNLMTIVMTVLWIYPTRYGISFFRNQHAADGPMPATRRA